jgi:hypothetical protein
MRDRVAYLHIPKSAGTSIRKAMRAHVGPDQTVPWSLDPILYGSHPLPINASERMFHDGIGDLSGYRFMAGHLALASIERGFDAADISCIVREPRTRLLSQYSFWRTYSEEEMEYWLPYDAHYLSRLPLGNFLQQPGVMHFVDNLMTRMIVGRHALIPVDDPIRDEDVEEVASLGCAHLDRLGFVDLLERGDVATERFEQWLGASVERETVNVTDPDAGVPVDLDDLNSTTTLESLDHRNQVDLLLWLHVAAKVGIEQRAARRLADATYARAVATLTRRTLESWDRRVREMEMT